MFVTKVEILIAHDDERLNTEKLEEDVSNAIVPVLGENSNWEVRVLDTHEVTLGAIVYSIEEHQSLHALAKRVPKHADETPDSE